MPLSFITFKLTPNFKDELELAKKALLPNIALQLDGSQSVADEVSVFVCFGLI